jgi:hypothetical protein
MRIFFLAFCLLALLASAGRAQAIGFGWYVCSVEWRKVDKTIDGLREATQHLIATADSPALRRHLQGEIDDEIVDLCEEYGRDESPAGVDFYDTGFAEYVADLQRRRGTKDSFFTRFANPPYPYAVRPESPRPMIHPVYFVLSPAEVRALHAEVVALNAGEHPPEHAQLLLQMQGMLMKVMHDNWGPPTALASEYGNGERGLIFYGHD